MQVKSSLIKLVHKLIDEEESVKFNIVIEQKKIFNLLSREVNLKQEELS